MKANPALRCCSSIEILEARISPATLNLAGGVLTYTGSGVINNVLTLNVSGANYTFADSAETITLNAAATTAGFSGSGTNNISGPTSAVSSINILLGSGTDTFNLNGLVDPLTMTDGADADTVNVATGADVVGGALSLAAETMTITSLAGVTNLTLSADTLAVNGTPGFSGTLTIQQVTANRPINLGTETAGALSITGSEFDNLLHSGTTRIGNASSGAITISTTLVGIAGTLNLKTGAGITDTAAGGIQVGALAIDADANVVLDGANDVAELAALISDTGASFTYSEFTEFQIATVDGIGGITTDVGAGEFVSLSAGLPVTQSAGGNIITEGLRLLGNSSYTLTDSTNNVTTLAANVGGSLSFTDATGLIVGSDGGTAGITTSNDSVTLIALNGDLMVLNANGAAAADIAVGTASVSLTAGSVGAVDNTLTIQANAGVTATGGVTLIGDNMSIAAPVNAGASTATLQPSQSATSIDLGGADAASKLGLSDAEIDLITAGILRIGKTDGAGINVTAAISPANTGTLSLRGVGNATDSGAGALVVANLAVTGNGVNLDSGTNQIGTIAGSATGNFATAFNIVNTGALTVGTVDGSTGVTATRGGVTLSTTGALAIEAPLQGENAPTRLTATTAQFAAGTTFTPRLNGVTPGTQHDQIAVTGAVNLAGASLAATVGFVPAPDTQFVIVSNDGVDSVGGTFAGLAEGAFVTLGGMLFRITYAGGDGNDVALITPPALAVTVVNPKTVTFTDVDGDLVTVKTTRGTFTGSEFTGIELGANGAGQLQTLALGSGFTGANLTITAKRSPNGGNGFVNLGFLEATGVDLGAVSIAGDLGRLSAGTAAGDPKVPGLKSLTVQSLGLLGTSTQGGSGGALVVTVQGALPKLVVKNDLRANVSVNGTTEGRLGTLTVGGSIVATSNVVLSAEAGIGTLKVGGDIRTTSNGFVSIRSLGGALGAITIRGSIVGVDVGHPVEISAFGQLVAPASGPDLALKSLAVKGTVERLTLFAGGLANANADASIGSIAVGGDWIASTVVAGVGSGADFTLGTADDTKVNVIVPAARDAAARFSTIGSFTVKGQALGTATTTTDMFGIVAERIGKAKVGGRTFAFTNGATPEAFFAAPTGAGAGAENPAFDFTIRELGSTTPTPAFGGPNLVVSTDGKTATFTDVDGDKVTVKRTLGAFVAGDFAITANASGGGQLTKLTLTAALNNAPVTLTITAQPGPNGGNGFVNIDNIAAAGVAMGSVSVAGHVGKFLGGQSVGGKPGVASFSAHSLGALGVSAVSPSAVGSGFTGGLGKLSVGADVRGANLAADKIGAVVIGGSFLGDGVGNGTITTNDGLGSVKIGGSMRRSFLSGGAGAIGAITIGGDLVGLGSNPVLTAFGQLAAPAKGLDLAIKSLTVKGNIENARIEVGGGNADASIGAISVSRAWLGSSVLAGVKAGTDTLVGTADDAKITAPTRDVATRFSTIASIVIKGQALGSTAVGDHFGIVAERIVKAKIGAVAFAFKAPTVTAPNREAFAAAPTGPGAVGLESDFFLREITI